MAASTVIDPAWTFDDQNTSKNGRDIIGLFLSQAAGQPTSHVAWRDGVLPSVFNSGTHGSYRVRENSPTGMTVLVNPGGAVKTRSGQGPYVCPNSATRTVALDPAHATNPRIDSIILDVTDTGIGDGSTQVVLRTVTGTASGTPSAPPIPSTAMELARVAVAANATTIVNANITDRRTSSALAGGTRWLLPGDSLSDPGEIPGERRVRSVTAAGAPFQQEYWDDSTSTWRGTEVQAYSLDLTVTTPLTFASATILTLAIPDPGFPYQLVTSMDWHGLIGTPATITVEARLDTLTGTKLTRSAIYPPGGAGDSGIPSPPPLADINLARTGRSATLTGGHTVLLTVTHLGGGAGHRSWGSGGTGLTVLVIPARS